MTIRNSKKQYIKKLRDYLKEIKAGNMTPERTKLLEKKVAKYKSKVGF